MRAGGRRDSQLLEAHAHAACAGFCVVRAAVFGVVSRACRACCMVRVLHAGAGSASAPCCDPPWE